TFNYDIAGRLRQLVDPAQHVYQYDYDTTTFNLVSVTDPTNKIRTYRYENSTFPNALTGIIDENGDPFATFEYDSQGRVATTEHAGGAERYTFSYETNTTTVTDPLGVARQYVFQNVVGVPRLSGITGPFCPSCGPKIITYDTNGFVATQTDWNDNRTNYSINSRGLEESRTEGLTSTGGSTPQTRTITTTWHPIYRLPALITEPGRTTLLE